MTAPAALILYAALVAGLGPMILRRIPWLERSPRLGIAVWQALSLSLVSAVVFAGLSLAIPAIPWTTDLAEFIRACAMTLLAQYSTPGGAAVSATGAVAALAVLGRVCYSLIAVRVRLSRDRQTQLDALAVLGERHRDYDAFVIEHASAAAYCLPGRQHRVVLTSAALTALDHNQLIAVLAHEQAHLRGRHHLILAAAETLHCAFPRIGIFREARGTLGRLVEMLADDDAARRSGRTTVATALVRLAEHGLAPAPALGAGGESAVIRVRRLVAPHRPLGAARTVIAGAGAGVLLALPLFFALAPATAAGTMPPCPPGDTSLTM